MKINVAIVGATGYAGSELVRLFETHPNANVTIATSGRSAGKPLRDECPWLCSDLVLAPFEPESLEADFIFLCQEVGFAMGHAKQLLTRAKVIDLSADFRLRDSTQYEKYYKRAHTSPELDAVYGLPELVDRQCISKARLIANPGCYPTGSLLALMPLATAGLVDRSGVTTVDAKSGVSGAGRSKQETEYLFTELSGGFKAYAVTDHRHIPEIEQTFGGRVRFTPHLIPVPRGLQVTAHVPLIEARTDLADMFLEFYKDDPFVFVQNSPPSTKQVIGANTCVIHPSYDEHTGCAVIVSVIDNLVKGAAGQAIQNMNLMAGLPETLGLPKSGIWP